MGQVHFNKPMNPLELEMYHQIKNVISVNPTFYEYLFLVDADTTVDPFSESAYLCVRALLLLCTTRPDISVSMIHDQKLLGVCGETELANAKQSLITMMQVSPQIFLQINVFLICWFVGIQIFLVTSLGKGV